MDENEQPIVDSETPEDEYLDQDIDDESEGIEEPEEDEDEVDYEGKKYKVPKELKDALLRQSDYTRKTQELAEMRRAVTAQASELNEARAFSQAATQHAAKIHAIDETLNQYAGVNWQALIQQDPQAAQQHWMLYQQAKDSKQKMVGELSQMQNMFKQRVSQHRQKQIEVGVQELMKSVPNIQENLPKIIEHGKRLGFHSNELDSVMDPRFFLALYEASKNYEYEAKLKQPTAKPEAQQPVTSIKARSGGAAKLDLVKDASKMSADEWAKRRNEQLRKSRGR